ncbi:MAG: hypothetical protein IT332_05925 [Ardenticatenales bacterium]|nr:hypothetical protein [Ardenticatenales bacterium]
MSMSRLVGRAPRRHPALLARVTAGVLALGLGTSRPGAAQSAVGDWTAPVWPFADGWHSDVAVALDVAGVVHVAFTAVDLVSGQAMHGDDWDGNATSIGYAAHAASGWTPPERVPCGRFVVACSDPAVAVDALGIVHLAYVAVLSDGAEIRHRQRVPGTVRWSDAERVSAGANGVRRLDPAILADRIGHVHVVWTDGTGGGDVLYRQRLPDGQWREVSAVHDPTNGAQSSPALTLAANGTVHAVWRDGRDGQLAVWTSQLPERSFVWWPDAVLSRIGDGVAGPPAIAATADGVVRAVWVATDGSEAARMMLARLTAAGPYWEPSRRLYEGEHGTVLDVAAAAAPNADLGLAWTESRAAGRSRLYAGRLDAAGQLVDTRRVDGTVRDGTARHPVLAAGGTWQAMLAWNQPAARGRPAIAFSGGRLPEPERAQQSFEGYLEPESVVFGCQRDGYRIVACDGTSQIIVLSDAPALARVAGAYIAVEGEVIDEPGCRRVVADTFTLRTPPCARSAASVFGGALQDGRPLPGARIVVGQQVALSGRSGRFSMTGVAPATLSITATAPCALALSAGTVDLQPRQRLDLGTAAFLSGDVVPDCVIDVRDLARAAWDVRQPPDDTNACSDVNRDGAVNVVDLELIRQRMGLRCPQTWSPTPMPPAAVPPGLEVFDGF